MQHLLYLVLKYGMEGDVFENQFFSPTLYWKHLEMPKRSKTTIQGDFCLCFIFVLVASEVFFPFHI